MAAQGERVSGAIGSCSVVGRPMVQDIPEQDIVMGELELPPQMDPEPEMGGAAAEAAVYDTSPPPLRQNPPILAESAQLSAPDIAQLCAMLAGLNAKMDGNTRKMEGMESNMDGIKANTNGIKEEMKKNAG